MSVQTEIDRISGNIASSLDAVANKGVPVPEYANSDSLPGLIEQIEVGVGEHSHSWNEITNKPSTFPPAEHAHTAEEVGALPSTYTPPVTSVNGQTGDVVIAVGSGSTNGGVVDSVNGVSPDESGNVQIASGDILYTGDYPETIYYLPRPIYPDETINDALGYIGECISYFDRAIQSQDYTLGILVAAKILLFQGDRILTADGWERVGSAWVQHISDVGVVAGSAVTVDVSSSDVILEFEDENGNKHLHEREDGEIVYATEVEWSEMFTAENVAMLAARQEAYTLVDFVAKDKPDTNGLIFVCLGEKPSIDIRIGIRVMKR